MPGEGCKNGSGGGFGVEKDGSPRSSGSNCLELGELASKTRCREVSVRICIIQRHAYEGGGEVRVARAARFYRFRASACSRAAANCSLMQASERARCFSWAYVEYKPASIALTSKMQLCVWYEVAYREAASRGSSKDELFGKVQSKLMSLFSSRRWKIKCFFIRNNRIAAPRVKVNVSSFLQFPHVIAFSRNAGSFFRVTYSFEVTFVARKGGDSFAQCYAVLLHRAEAAKKSLCSLHSEERTGKR